MDRKSNQRLTKEEVEKTKKSSILEGSCYEIMYSFGEQYIVPYALKLGASSPEVALLSSAPVFLGSVFQLLGGKLIDRFKNRKTLTMFFTLMQALSLLPLFIIPFFTKSMLLLTIIFSLYQILGGIVGPIWSSWLGDVVPAAERAPYFAHRNRITVAVQFLSIFLAGAILSLFNDLNVWIGFAILFTIAFIGRIMSWQSFRYHIEPPVASLESKKLRFMDFLSTMNDTDIGNFVIFRSAVAFTVTVAAPFFAVYMLNDLHFNYLEFSAVLLMPIVMKVLSATYWSAYSGRFGNRNILYVSAWLISLVPLLWLLAGILIPQKPFLLAAILVAEGFSGFAWAGFELTTFNYMLDASEQKDRVRLFSYYTAMLGVAVLGGGLLGSFLALNLAAFSNEAVAILTIFLISFVLRLLSVMVFIPKVNEMRPMQKIDPNKILVQMIFLEPIGFALNATFSSTRFIGKRIKNIRKPIERDRKK